MDDREGVVATYYDRLAPVYGEGAYFRARREAMLRAAFGESEISGRLLDLGCGNGAFLSTLEGRPGARRAHGVDLSPAMLAEAHRRLPPSAPLLRADALALPFRSGVFDLVFMSHVLLLMSDMDACIAEVRRVLANGGRLIATVGSAGRQNPLAWMLTAEDRQELQPVFSSSRMRAVEDDESRALTACGRIGLVAEVREEPFRVDWAALEEWLRIRWLSIAEEDVRRQVECRLEEIRGRQTATTAELSERVLVARRE